MDKWINGGRVHYHVSFFLLCHFPIYPFEGVRACNLADRKETYA